jgi:hypothetical protein
MAKPSQAGTAARPRAAVLGLPPLPHFEWRLNGGNGAPPLFRLP